MKMKVLDAREKEIYAKEIVDLLTESDNDFVPPLSKRSSPLDKSFDVSNRVNGIFSYFEEMKKQEILAAFEGDEMLGFVSYRRDFVNEIITKEEFPNIYVSTLVLKKSARGRGLTKIMYSYLFSELYADRSVFTRTWSTNFAHTKILQCFGFSEIIRKENDRGNGIDTVYYKRERCKTLLGAGEALTAHS